MTLPAHTITFTSTSSHDEGIDHFDLIEKPFQYPENIIFYFRIRLGEDSSSIVGNIFSKSERLCETLLSLMRMLR